MLETPTTSCKSNQSMQELPTPHISHQPSHTNSSLKFSPKLNIPPTLPYTRQYKYKVKKSLPKKEDECCVVLGSLVREKMKNPKCIKHLQLERPELNHEQIETCGIEKEILMASRLGAKGKFETVTSIKNKLKKKYTSLRKASKQCRNVPWKTLHKIFNP